jgi:hypothetical protein
MQLLLELRLIMWCFFISQIMKLTHITKIVFNKNNQSFWNVYTRRCNTSDFFLECHSGLFQSFLTQFPHKTRWFQTFHSVPTCITVHCCSLTQNFRHFIHLLLTQKIKRWFSIFFFPQIFGRKYFVKWDITK